MNYHPHESYGLTLYNTGVRVFLVLDFDGVINAFGIIHELDLPDSPGFGKWASFKQKVTSELGYRQSYTIRWSSEMIERINAILDDPRVQLCWLTSWKTEVLNPARRMELAISSARQPVVIDYPITSSDDQIGKLSGISEFFKGVPDQASLIWVDDYLLAEDGGYYSMVEGCIIDLDFGEILTMGPDSLIGISPEDMSVIEDFLASQP